MKKKKVKSSTKDNQAVSDYHKKERRKKAKQGRKASRINKSK